MLTHALAINSFKLILAIFALMFITIGIDKGLGGIITLGLQNQVQFIDITDTYVFSVQDSHMRFFGGMFIGLGLFLARAMTDLVRYQSSLQMILGIVFIGGLARLSQLDLSLLLGTDLVGSVMAELVVMPLLYLWLQKICAKQALLSKLAVTINSTP